MLIDIENQTNKFIFFNSLGIVFENGVIFNQHNKVPIRLNEIRKIIVKKERRYRWNFLLLLNLLILVIVFFKLKNHLMLESKIFCISFMGFVAFLMLYYKNFKYSVILMKHDSIIKIEVKKENKTDALNIVRKINQVIKKNNSSKHE